MDRLSEIRARCEELEQSGEGFTVVRPVYIQGALLDDGYSEKWSAVAAHAREDIPFLLAEVERLQGELQDQEYQISLDAMEQSRDEATARAEKAEAALSDMRFAYVNKDPGTPHQFEEDALKAAADILGEWPPKEGE